MRYRCKSCKHYDGRECHARPPVFHTARGRAFPAVSEQDWCGEHKLQLKDRKKPAPSTKLAGTRPERSFTRDDLVSGVHDEIHPSVAAANGELLLGLLEVLGEARGDKGMVVWTAANLDPFRGADTVLLTD